MLLPLICSLLDCKVNLVRPEGVRKARVKVPHLNGHVLLNESNNMEWHITVDSGAQQELSLVYTVEHPAQDLVNGLPK